MKVSPYLLILLVLTTLVSGTHAAEVTLDRTRYVPGEPITVRFKNAPGNTKDWVGLYVEGKSAQDYFAWQYLDGTEVGSVAVTAGDGDGDGDDDDDNDDDDDDDDRHHNCHHRGTRQTRL